MAGKVYDFDSAIVRLPAASVAQGIRAVDRGDPSYAGVRREHDAYVAALREAGLAVEVLEPLEAFPDSIFVEDPALVFTAGAITLRPGDPRRAGEADLIDAALRLRFDTVLRLDRGHVDGGDVLRTPDRVLIGLSARTTREGAEALIAALAELGETGQIVETPADVLHFKTDCSLLDDDVVLTTRRLSASGVFSGFKELIAPEGEEAAANALRINDRVLVGRDYPRTIALLRQEGYAVTPLATSEIGKIDAGLSCMSLRWRSGPSRV